MDNQSSPGSDLPQRPRHPEVLSSIDISNDSLPASSDLMGKKSKSRKAALVILSVLLAILAVAGLVVGWYYFSLSPVSSDSKSTVNLEIKSGQSPAQIAEKLEEKQVIRSALAFRVYTKLSGKENSLQAGSYSLSSASTTQEIVSQLSTGSTDDLVVTFLPGATLRENRDSLIKLGYTASEVDKALSADDSHPLLRDKPKGASLEGYIYGETYHFSRGVSVSEILKASFDLYQSTLDKNNIEAGFKIQNLSLHQGIIIASIVQREVPGATDQRQVAQVFLSRYRLGMQLGSDITAYYGSDLMGKKRAVSTDTPYNTRIHTGLPPGPIASPGASALKAVANPAPGDYLYFLSGDDEVTYFARTGAEHDANISKHCRIKCDME